MTVYEVKLFMREGLNLPFRADAHEMYKIEKHLKRPKLLQSKAFQLRSATGEIALVNMRDVSITVMKELYEDENAENSSGFYKHGR